MTDKERFIAEKKNYKGPWQLPIKSDSQVRRPIAEFPFIFSKYHKPTAFYVGFRIRSDRATF